MNTPMKTFTILLHYADELAELYGKDMILTSVDATTVRKAQTLAQRKAFQMYFGLHDRDNPSTYRDFRVAAVFLGDQRDLKETK